MITTKVLVTGSNGQLGSELNKASAQYPNLQLLLTDIGNLDITNAQSCTDYINLHKPDYIINCAAYTAVDKAEDDVGNAWKINVEAVKNLLAACKPHSTAFIHISTDYVFDGKNYRPYVETDTVMPQSVYGRTKQQGEKDVLDYYKSMVVRTSWLYSAFGNNFVKTMLRLGAECEQLSIVFDQVGTPTYAGDLAGALLQIINDITVGEKNFVAGIYHYSNEGVCSWYDFALAIMQKAKLACNVIPIETKDYITAAKRPHYSVMNKSKIKTIFDIKIPHWKESLCYCIETLM
ncbi:MAG: dTDP-4-dehydrorhamnose reductase [Prevotellaceae bacterium]|jgi:dTDP-4-dehydrorhamnose reductase|nr:dTDP-4-dehydrorhamnose reductase [Prevotellaceae bacterium]